MANIDSQRLKLIIAFFSTARIIEELTNNRISFCLSDIDRKLLDFIPLNQPMSLDLCCKASHFDESIKLYLDNEEIVNNYPSLLESAKGIALRLITKGINFRNIGYVDELIIFYCANLYTLTDQLLRLN